MDAATTGRGARLLVAGGLFLTSASVVCLELTAMRILSFMLWHHVAYTVIAVAILGLGAGAAIVSALLSRRPAGSVAAPWPPALGAAGGFVLAFALVTRVRTDTFTLDATNLAGLALDYALLVLPFALAGSAVALTYMGWNGSPGPLYAADLAGAALGALLFHRMLEPLGAPRLVVVMGALMAGAGIPWALAAGQARGCRRALALVVILVTVAGWADDVIPARPAPSKNLAVLLATRRGARVVMTRWTPIARIDVLESEEPTNPFLPRSMAHMPMKTVTVDGDANTWLLARPDARQPLARPSPEEFGTYHAALLCHERPDVLIIGPGGGNEVFVTLQMGAASVLAVELNPVILEIGRDLYASFIGHVYGSDRVETMIAEGRSALRRLDRRFDVVQMSGVDTWAALASGAYVLSENYLYTVEAFTEMLGHLRPGGILSIERFRLDPPRETLRVVTLACEALRAVGRRRAREHIVVASYSTPLLARVLVKESPFLPGEIDRLTRAARTSGGEVLASPRGGVDASTLGLISAYTHGYERSFIEAYPYDVSPVYDERPFFFEYYRWSRILGDVRAGGRGGQSGANRPVALVVLGALLSMSVLLAAGIVLLPLVLGRPDGRKSGSMASRRGQHWRWAVYFASIGAGFMLVEIGLMQRLILLLDHPAYAVPAVLVSLLLWAAAGSALAGRLPLARRREPDGASENGARSPGANILALALVWTALVLAALPWATRQVGAWVGGASLPARLLAVFLLLLPVGLPMGMAFPAGIARLGREAPWLVGWAWGVNAAASVVGSVLVVLVGMAWGFSAAFRIAAVLYLIALVAIRSPAPPAGGNAPG
jgi:spermidine synthase